MANKTYQHVTHEFAPVYNEHSTILILGSLPSVKSREEGFYYGHKQNRFWKVIAAITKSDIPNTIEEKKELLLAHHIAIWDVIEECDIIGSSDTSIKNVIPIDIMQILSINPITHIFANGKKSYELYQKYLEPVTHQKAICLPSTSPANAAWSLEKLTLTWGDNIASHI